MMHEPMWTCPCVPIPISVQRACGHHGTAYVHRVHDESPKNQAEYLAGFLEGLDSLRHTPCRPDCEGGELMSDRDL